MLVYNNLDSLKSFAQLKSLPRVNLSEVMSSSRVMEYQSPVGGGLTYNYSAKAVDENILLQLSQLANEQQLIEKYKDLLSGSIVNVGEKRRVLHHLLRGQLGSDVVVDGRNLYDFYSQQLEFVRQFSDDVHQGKILGSTGKKIDTVVQIGIGGSDLGPRALYLALDNLYPSKLRAYFISNVDPDDVNAVLSHIDMETTLFILVSKSGTTQETLANYNFIIEKSQYLSLPLFDIASHVVAVTSETSPLATRSKFLRVFHIDDYIGGRYSSTSSVGGVVLSLSFGYAVFEELLAGAHEADKQALSSDIHRNAALLDALIGVYERNICGYNATVILPYSQALSRFPAHLQQLDMESNGKVVNRDGKMVDYATGMVIFGEPGTNGQHSFYQLLHQGSDVIPLQFIAFKKAQTVGDILYDDSTSQKKLNANLVAQIFAFAFGQYNENLNKNFTGQRPSSLIYGEQLTARSLGALLAHYENKVMFQGFLWNLNSFDQEGVQLGKLLTNNLLTGSVSDIMKTFWGLMDN